MGWLIAAGILLILAFLPLSGSVRYRQDGFNIRVGVGPLMIRVYPRKQPKESKPEPEQKPAAPQKQNTGEKTGGKWTDFLPLVRVALDFLGELPAKIRVRNLELHAVLAGEDPCDLALSCGSINAALAALLARLDSIFTIRKQNVTVDCDFSAQDTLVTADLDVRIPLARALSLAVRYGIRGFKTFLTIKEQREGGANL